MLDLEAQCLFFTDISRKHPRDLLCTSFGESGSSWYHMTLHSKLITRLSGRPSRWACQMTNKIQTGIFILLRPMVYMVFLELLSHFSQTDITWMS